MDRFSAPFGTVPGVLRIETEGIVCVCVSYVFGSLSEDVIRSAERYHLWSNFRVHDASRNFRKIHNRAPF
jgi:hypothetical protein